uniref:Uncharacterized protein n=1 Tax=Salmonella sp. TaxID=599 RepID=A0A482ETR4_SALSP|nr:hypothetical protein NNIBIDOC_00182 [Salmonella sp.]
MVLFQQPQNPSPPIRRWHKLKFAGCRRFTLRKSLFFSSLREGVNPTLICGTVGTGRQELSITPCSSSVAPPAELRRVAAKLANIGAAVMKYLSYASFVWLCDMRIAATATLLAQSITDSLYRHGVE